jgi:hypothetical protein
MRAPWATISVVVLSAGAFAAPVPAGTPNFVGTLEARYTLQLSGEKGVRTAHQQVPLLASLYHALTKDGLWAVSLRGKNYVGGPQCAAAMACSDVQAGITVGPSADLTFRDLRAIAVKESALRRKFTLSGSMKITGNGSIGEIDFDLWTCQGGLPPTAPCLHKADGDWVYTPAPIPVRAGENVAFTVEISLTLRPR